MRTNFRAPQPLVPTLRQPSSLPALAWRCAGSPVPTRNGLLLRISGGRARRNRLICILIFARPNPWLFPCVSALVATLPVRLPSSLPAAARIASWTSCVSPRRSALAHHAASALVATRLRNLRCSCRHPRWRGSCPGQPASALVATALAHHAASVLVAARLRDLRCPSSTLPPASALVRARAEVPLAHPLSAATAFYSGFRGPRRAEIG